MRLIEDFLGVDRTTARVVVGSLGLALVVLFIAESGDDTSPARIERPAPIVQAPLPAEPQPDKSAKPSLAELTVERAREAWDALVKSVDSFQRGFTRPDSSGNS